VQTTSSDDVDLLPDPAGAIRCASASSTDRSVALHAVQNVGDLLYDKDAMYIDIPDWKLHFAGASRYLRPGECVSTFLAGFLLCASSCIFLLLGQSNTMH
jgi:hypothetical protein